jgi:hypothetical protein
LRAHSAIRGDAIPNHLSSPSRVMRADSMMEAALKFSATLRRAMWVVASTTRSLSDASIMATLDPVRLPSISVWPGKS